jgi:hypothetical protein
MQVQGNRRIALICTVAESSVDTDIRLEPAPDTPEAPAAQVVDKLAEDKDYTLAAEVADTPVHIHMAFAVRVAGIPVHIHKAFVAQAAGMSVRTDSQCPEAV